MEATSSASIKYVSEIWYNFAVGAGAIGGGLFAVVKLVASAISIKRKASNVEHLKKLYPRTKLNKSFKLVDYGKAPGKVYLLDYKKNERYWIKTGETFLDLDFYWDDVTRVEEKEFNEYNEGPVIFTAGKLN